MTRQELDLRLAAILEEATASGLPELEAAAAAARAARDVLDAIPLRAPLVVTASDSDSDGRAGAAAVVAA